MINFDSIKSLFGGNKLTDNDLVELTKIFKNMSNEEILGAYKILKDSNSECLRLCKEELNNRGLFI